MCNTLYIYTKLPWSVATRFGHSRSMHGPQLPSTEKRGRKRDEQRSCQVTCSHSARWRGPSVDRQECRGGGCEQRRPEARGSAARRRREQERGHQHRGRRGAIRKVEEQQHGKTEARQDERLCRGAVPQIKSRLHPTEQWHQWSPSHGGSSLFETQRSRARPGARVRRLAQ